MSDSTRKQAIGFIGTGMMGHGICLNLLKAGYDLHVIVHRNRARVEDLVQRGAVEAKSRQDLVEKVDVVMICVNSAEAVAAIVEEILPLMASGKAIIDVTTSKPETSQALSRLARQRGVAFIEAPVVGGPQQAAEGKLGTFVGGEAEDLAKVAPILNAYSTDFVHFGPAGAGNTAKLLNNFLSIGLRQLVVQAFRAARRNNVDWEKLYRLARQGAAASRTLDTIVAGAIEGDYTRNKFSIANCLKDITYVAPLLADDPDGKAIQSAMAGAYRRLVDAGLGDRLASEMLDARVEEQGKGRA